MNRIASFCVNHNELMRGIYISRVDDDIVTYDIRMRRPNMPPFISNEALHTIEHLFATFARNSEFKENIIYFGPMGCRTGCYFLVRNMKNSDVVKLVIDTFEAIATFEGTIPGATATECGNYLEHDLDGAREEAKKFLTIIRNWSETKLKY